MVCVIELDAVAIDESDGCVRTEGRDRELFQEISPNLKVCGFLSFAFVCPRLPEPLFRNPTIGTTRSRPVMYLPCLWIRFERLIHRAFSGRRKVWSREYFVKYRCAGSRGGRFPPRESPRRGARVDVALLRVSPCFLSVIERHCKRLSRAYRSASTSACTTHRPRHCPRG